MPNSYNILQLGINIVCTPQKRVSVYTTIAFGSQLGKFTSVTSSNSSFRRYLTLNRSIPNAASKFSF